MRFKGRTFLLVLTAVLLISTVLAACGGSSEPAGNANSGGNSNSGTATNSGSEKKEEPKQATNSGGGKKLEIFSWWTNGGEADGLNALYEVFKKQYPDVEIINATVAGGAGTNAKAVLAARMQGGEPPDSFQVHGGAELNDGWVAADKMEPLDFLYDQEGWRDKFPKALIDMVSKDGKIWSVPINAHRGNVLWYNKKIFDDNGLKAPETFEEFFQVADALKAKGITPFAFGSKEGWEATHVFETVLVGTLGPDGYKKLWTGEIKLDSAEVKQAFETFKKMLSYTNNDHPARNWQSASTLIQDGKAGMYIMGDWAQGYFTSVNLKPNVDYGYVPAPGNKGTFMIVNDSFGLPKGAKNRDQAINFLKVLGSKEGQERFNPLKGSSPARIDLDKSKFDSYLQDQMNEFKTNQLTPSLAHGSAAKEGFLTEANKIIGLFVSQQDADKAASALQKAAEANKLY